MFESETESRPQTKRRMLPWRAGGAQRGSPGAEEEAATAPHSGCPNSEIVVVEASAAKATLGSPPMIGCSRNQPQTLQVRPGTQREIKGFL